MKHHITMGYIIYTHISTYICIVELEKACTSKKTFMIMRINLRRDQIF